jgi:hypothetical protein
MRHIEIEIYGTRNSGERGSSTAALIVEISCSVAWIDCTTRSKPMPQPVDWPSA